MELHFSIRYIHNKYIFFLKLRKKIAATANIFDGKIYGDFPVNSKQIVCKKYQFFSMQYLLVYLQ